jgi:hemerythrin-like domain-containing protein
MSTIADFLGHDHNRCDELYAAAEEAAGRGDWNAAQAANAQFIASMEHHFGMEEQVLFPSFEQVAGPMGPTQVMRHEHSQMRQLFDEMNQAAAGRDADNYLGAAETLLILMQQHNAKEEQILYPMTDRMLGSASSELVTRMQAVENP